MDIKKNPYQKFDEDKNKTQEELEEERKNEVFVKGMLRNMKLKKYLSG